MRVISKNRTKGWMKGRGKYGMSVTHKGKRALMNQTFRTKKRAEEALKRAKSEKHSKKIKNPRIVQFNYD